MRMDKIIVHPLAGAPGRLLEDALGTAGLSCSDGELNENKSSSLLKRDLSFDIIPIER